MPLKLEITVGSDTFNLDGDFTITDVVPALKEWGRLIGLPAGQDEVDILTGRLKQSNDALQAVVDNTPKET